MEHPRWQLVDVEPVRRLPRMVTLAEIKADPCLRDMRVAQRGNRLSVMPVSCEAFERVLAQAESDPS